MVWGAMIVEPGLAHILEVMVGGSNWNLQDLTTVLLCVMASAASSGAAVISLISQVSPGTEGDGRVAVLELSSKRAH